ncbi:hypothetical protein [Ramlibacter sp. PS4R-6]
MPAAFLRFFLVVAIAVAAMNAMKVRAATPTPCAHEKAGHAARLSV